MEKYGPHQYPQPGEKRRQILKTTALRQECFRQYCLHLAHGRNKRSFVFNHPHYKCSWETVERYIRQYPEEFDLELLDVAYAEGLGVWEQILTDCATGKNRKANVAAIQITMRNKYGWERQEGAASKQELVEAMAHFASLRNFLASTAELSSELHTVTSIDHIESETESSHPEEEAPSV